MSGHNTAPPLALRSAQEQLRNGDVRRSSVCVMGRRCGRRTGRGRMRTLRLKCTTRCRAVDRVRETGPPPRNTLDLAVTK